ncbi:ATP-binding protein [Gemmiger sp. An120]|uniref:energy-coupling factor ABC transporter ATP-binding protein n=1 Tax=Gemmiger sp. An120 TaxID=1965549 RepID=UPI000B371281|nr:ABC transporter ATP-binding protein [Gemmiger sp. An120]OUQ42050.1 ATP-binding protein [Gemmiger sp. An120]
MQELLRFEDVSYAYEPGRDALRGLTVSVAAGERVAVLGNNGAGKSTFFLLANGVLQPRAGQVIFEGVPVRRAADLNRLRRGVGLVFQDPDVQLLAGTVEQEVSFGPMNLRLPEDEVAHRVDEALAAFGLEAYRQRAPQYLSGGEKKRVTLADVLAMDPRLLLLDEPAASLDPAHARLLEQNLARLSGQGLALVVATHDVDFAWRWAERVLLFHNGQLAADGTPETIFADRTLLATCGLEQPVLFRAGRALGLNPLPRTVEQLEQAVGPKGDAG